MECGEVLEFQWWERDGGKAFVLFWIGIIGWMTIGIMVEISMVLIRRREG